VKILLDTVTLLWIAGDDPRLSDRAQRAFVEPSNEVFLSAVSAWEIAVKYSLGRLTLPAPPERILPELRSRYGIAALPLSEEATYHLERLPKHHRDPFDRMLICQAVAHGLTLLTPDPQIQLYPVATVW